MNATEMEKAQLIAETWKTAAQQVIDMLVAAREPDKLLPGCIYIYIYTTINFTDKFRNVWV